MKFVSKNSNYRITLEPGIPREPLTGRPAKPAIFVKFENGIAEVKDEGLIKKLENHLKYKVDFHPIENEITSANSLNSRIKDGEKSHIITEMQYGQPGKTLQSPKKVQLDPEMKEMLKGMAKEMAKEMVGNIIKEMSLVEEKNKQINIENKDSVKSNVGRPKKELIEKEEIENSHIEKK